MKLERFGLQTVGLKPGDELTLLDLGAYPVPSDPPIYSRLVEVAPCNLIALDAITFEEEALSSSLPGLKTLECIFSVIGDGGPSAFYQCHLPTRSSLYEPCPTGVRRFDSIGRLMQVVETHQVETSKLDELVSGRCFDFVKMDLQGGELLALRHGKQALSRSVVVQVEVEFIQQYLNQPLFSDVDVELRGLGFEFHRFLGYGTRPPSSAPHLEGTQWLWSDAVYIRRDEYWVGVGAQKLRKGALVLLQCYRSYDMALAMLEEADLLDGGKSSDLLKTALAC